MPSQQDFQQDFHHLLQVFLGNVPHHAGHSMMSPWTTNEHNGLMQQTMTHYETKKRTRPTLLSYCDSDRWLIFSYLSNEEEISSSWGIVSGLTATC